MNSSLGLFNLTTMYVVYAYAFPSLTVRFYDVVVMGFLKTGLQSLDVGAWVFLVFAVGAPLFVIYGQFKKLRNWVKWTGQEWMDRDKIFKVISRPDRRWIRLIVAWYIPMAQQMAEVVLMTYWAVLSYKLPYLLMSGTAITAQTAGEVGAAGFYLFCSFLNVWVPSDTPFRILQQAVSIRGGAFLPIGGFRQLQEYHEDHQHLGLERVIEIVGEFRKEHPMEAAGLTDHGVAVELGLLEEWEAFAVEKLDENKHSLAPVVGDE